MSRFGSEDRDARPGASVPRAENDFHPSGAIADLLGVCRLLGQDLLAAYVGANGPPTRQVIPVDSASGGFDLTTAATLRLEPRAGLDESLYNHPVIVWGGSRQRVQIIRGEPVRVTRVGQAFTLTWSRGPLELQVPTQLAGLSLRAAGSEVRVHRFDGPIEADLFRGRLEIRGLHAPFRVRGLGTPVVLRECAVGAGESSVATTGGDILVEFSSAASLRVEAVSLAGWIESRLGPSPNRSINGARNASDGGGPGADAESQPEGRRTAWGDRDDGGSGGHVDPTDPAGPGGRRRRGAEFGSPLERRSLRIGSGRGRLRLDTAGGWIQLRGDPGAR